MTEPTRFILDGKEPVPCDSFEDWQRFMDDVAGRTVAQDVVGDFRVITTFAGLNLGEAESPRFFETAVVDNGDPPFLSETWEQAESKHRKVAQAVERLNNITEEDIANGYRFVDCEILADDEVRFLMESEETAIAALPEPVTNWHREGRTLVFKLVSSNP
jgi:hypothetical protein